LHEVTKHLNKTFSALLKNVCLTKFFKILLAAELGKYLIKLM